MGTVLLCPTLSQKWDKRTVPVSQKNKFWKRKDEQKLFITFAIVK